jgi:selenocysteine lyase/cysteine desulfurase
MVLDINGVRSHFPALSSGFIFADNAGGSQILKDVVDRMSDYLLKTNCQLGADYSVSAQSSQRVESGSVDMATLFNAESADEIVFGASSTTIMGNLTRAMESDIRPGDEFVITGEHEGKYERVCEASVSDFDLTDGFASEQWSMEGCGQPSRCSHQILEGV